MLVMDPWALPACPACRGKGEVVMVGRSWISLRCDDCCGLGVVLPDLPPIAAAVVTSQRSVLMVRREAAEGDLVWQFPAGEVHEGETPADTAVRETAEATGLKVVVARELGERVHATTGRNMRYLACEVVDGEELTRTPRDITEVRWCSLAELTELVPEGFYTPVRHYLEGHLS